MSWRLVPTNDERSDEEESLVKRMETYTHELSLLCGRMETRQFEAASDDDVDVEGDTLKSLQEMLLTLARLIGKECEYTKKKQQTHQLDELKQSFCHQAGLAHEFERFADELYEFLSTFEDTSAENGLPLNLQHKERKYSNINKKENSNGQADTIAVNSTRDADMDETNPSYEHNSFNERANKAIAMHVKRQKQLRCKTGNRVSFLSNDQAVPIDQNRAFGIKVTFQSKSYQQHITRQRLARWKVKQRQDAQRLAEVARLTGSKPSSSCLSKTNSGRLAGQSTQITSYSSQFKSSSVQSISCAIGFRYLCAVYLYGRRSLGTTFISFDSLVQLEQRIQAKFAIDKVTNIYRELTGQCKRHANRFQRILTLESLNDGDTLCVTQSSYDDMMLLCDWIKQRQRVNYNYQVKARPPATKMSLKIAKKSKQKCSKVFKGAGNMPQVWDSNGRSIGIDASSFITEID